MNWKRILAGTSIGAGLLVLGNYIFKAKQTVDDMATVVKARIHSMELDGITIRVDAILKNPGQKSFTIKFPFVTLSYEKKTLGTSKSLDKDITIPAHGEAVIDAIMIKIPFMGILSTFPDLLKKLTTGEGAVIEAKVLSTIDLGVAKKQYEKTEMITLKV